MHLGNRHVAGVLRRVVIDDHVTVERNSAVLVALLLEPGESEPVRVQPGDDVVELVAVDVVHAELGTSGTLGSAPSAERLGMINPRARDSAGRLLPPTGRLQNVDASIAVHVA